MAPCDVFTRILFALLAIAGLATGCRSTESAAPAASLIGTSWLAEEIDEQRVLERIESTLSFDSAQRITGQAACNRYFGALELGEGTIRLKPAGTTRMACAPAVMDQESRFLAAQKDLVAASEPGRDDAMTRGDQRSIRLIFEPCRPMPAIRPL